MVPSIERFHCIQDSQLDPNGVLYREVPLCISFWLLPLSYVQGWTSPSKYTLPNFLPTAFVGKTL